jgi:hypothetical protein
MAEMLPVPWFYSIETGNMPVMLSFFMPEAALVVLSVLQ